MPGVDFTFGMLALLLVMIGLGFHIVVALGAASVLGVWILTGNPDVALSILSTTAFEALRDYVFAVIPLFVLMGEFVARSGAAKDLYVAINRLLRHMPARLAVATVFGNAVFAAVVGVSVASAATFSRIAYPQMLALRYEKTTALGCIAGSSSLGMLIPPSVLMIVWGVLTELSIGKLFMAGFLPGIILAVMYAGWCVVLAMIAPSRFGHTGAVARGSPTVSEPPMSRSEIVGSAGTALLIIVVLGGIWFGAFTPTEAAGIGALAALAIALAKGMRRHEILEVVSETGRTSAPILFLLLCAQMYSRLLALGGIVDDIQSMIIGFGFSPVAIMCLMVVIWLFLGMFVDSVSIILLTVPIFTPIAGQMGIDPIAFAIVGILAIEAGILTPPFGLAVFTVKACVPDPDVTLGQIFRGAAPYWVMLIGLAAAVYAFPGIATTLPLLM